MKITCERDKFSQAFLLAASVSATKDVKPVLQNVLLKVENDSVILMATDTEIGIRINVSGCEISEPGTVILPTKLMRSILSENQDKTLEITGSNEKTIVQGSRSRFQLPTQPSDDFPEVEPFPEKTYHTVAAPVFRELIKRTVFATDEDNTRYTLGGVLLDFSEDKIGAVATDGRRLAHQEGTAESVNGHAPEGSSIFPAKALALVERAAGEEEMIQIAVSPNRAVFQTPQTVIYTRLIEGKFPRWKNIVPETDQKVVIELIAGAFLSAVRQAAIVTSEKQPGVEFSFDSGKLELRASGAEIGESTIDLPIAYTGEKLNLKIDPKFVTDFLRVLDAEKQVTLYLSKTGEPVLCRTDDHYEYVIMPLS